MGDDELPATIPATLERAAQRFGSHEAVVDGPIRLTFTELADAVDEAARALVASGVEPEDRVAIWAPNVAEWVVTALGVHRSGAVLVPLNTRFKGSEAGYILRTAGARLLFTVTDFLDTDYVTLLAEVDTPLVEEIVVLRGPDTPDTTSWKDFLARAVDVRSSVIEDRTAAITGDSTSDILFTSGTTGAPKGAMLRHGATVRAFDTWSSLVGLNADDRYLVVNPFFHAFGLKAGILACVLTGATIVPHAVFDIDSVMLRIGEERVTMLPGPPAIFQAMLDHPDLDRSAVSTLRLSATGAAHVPVELVRRMKDELGFETVVTAYGLTEATGIATMCRHDDDVETIANTSGRAIPGVEVRVVDDDGNPLAAGAPGEVVVRGYNVMSGYFADPAATTETIDPEGWLHTGDIGVLDDAGNLKITDRKKDMFIVGGFNTYPAEIETILQTHPEVGQAAVIGVPDPRLGEVGVAFVVPAADAEVDPDELAAWAREHMANYKVPRRFEVVDQLPVNASNKVMKFELRDRAVER